MAVSREKKQQKQADTAIIVAQPPQPHGSMKKEESSYE
jgi:hypothetical protein